MSSSSDHKVPNTPPCNTPDLPLDIRPSPHPTENFDQNFKHTTLYVPHLGTRTLYMLALAGPAVNPDTDGCDIAPTCMQHI